MPANKIHQCFSWRLNTRTLGEVYRVVTVREDACLRYDKQESIIPVADRHRCLVQWEPPSKRSLVNWSIYGGISVLKKQTGRSDIRVMQNRCVASQRNKMIRDCLCMRAEIRKRMTVIFSLHRGREIPAQRSERKKNPNRVSEMLEMKSEKEDLEWLTSSYLTQIYLSPTRFSFRSHAFLEIINKGFPKSNILILSIAHTR